ncbi:MAG: sulfite exporter TauE/SafE family protein [Pseudomonadota bacterium]
MLNDPLFVALAVVAVLFAGVSKGGFGSGASFAAAPLMALVIEPQVALGIMMPVLIVIDLTAVRPYWRKWDWAKGRLLMLSAIPGLLLGYLLLSVAPTDVLRGLIGAVALLFVAWRLLGAHRMEGGRPLPAWVGALCGATAGFTSFVSHAGGPLVAVYMLSRQIDKTTYQATTVLIFGVLNAVKVGLYVPLGLYTADTLVTSLWLAPVAVVGTYLGVWAHRVVPERVFFGLTYVMLICAGSKLLWDAFT